MSVGLELQRAIARAKEHEATSVRRVRVRFAMRTGKDANDGLWITAGVPARSGEELEGQKNVGGRMVPWHELDARAGELTGIVDAVVAEVLAAVGVKPSG